MVAREQLCEIHICVVPHISRAHNAFIQHISSDPWLSKQVLILLLALVHFSVVVLSAIAVWAGIDDNQSHYNGQVKIDLNNYTITKVGGSPLRLRCISYLLPALASSILRISNLSCVA